MNSKINQVSVELSDDCNKKLKKGLEQIEKKWQIEFVKNKYIQQLLILLNSTKIDPDNINRILYLLITSSDNEGKDIAFDYLANQSVQVNYQFIKSYFTKIDNNNIHLVDIGIQSIINHKRFLEIVDLVSKENNFLVLTFKRSAYRNIFDITDHNKFAKLLIRLGEKNSTINEFIHFYKVKSFLSIILDLYSVTKPSDNILINHVSISLYSSMEIEIKMACKALARPDSQVAKEILLDYLQYTNTVHTEALWSLSVFKLSNFSEIIMENSRKLDNEGVAIAISLLSKENHKGDFKDFIITYSNHPDKNIRYEAIKALDNFDDPEVIEVLKFSEMFDAVPVNRKLARLILINK